jgi:hypothetical protein
MPKKLKKQRLPVVGDKVINLFPLWTLTVTQGFPTFKEDIPSRSHGVVTKVLYVWNQQTHVITVDVKGCVINISMESGIHVMPPAKATDCHNFSDLFKIIR